MERSNWLISLGVGILGYLFAVLFLSDELSIFARASVGIFVFWLTTFVLQLSNGIPLKALMLIICIMQWLIGPVLAYYYYPNSEFYYMAVDEPVYMAYVFPALVVFMFGLIIFGGRDTGRISEAFRKLQLNGDKLKTQGYILIALGLIVTFLRPSLPPSLRYLGLLLSYMRIVGAFYLLLANVRFKWLWMIGVFSLEVIGAFGNAMFHDLLLWVGYLFMIYAFTQKIGLVRRLALLAVLGYGVFLIQAIKKDYREVVWENKQLESTAKLETAVNIARGVDGGEVIGKSEQVQDFVDRINQGWIIGRIIFMVPRFEPYAKGGTVEKAVQAAFVPRILAPNKAKSGGKENFTRFTGIIVDEGTSMDLSIVGEAYANYGGTGGIIFMLIMGLFYGGIFRFVVYFTKKYPELVLWLPFVFFYTVKAENDLATALNQLTKSLMVMAGMVWLLNRYLPGSREAEN